MTPVVGWGTDDCRVEVLRVCLDFLESLLFRTSLRQLESAPVHFEPSTTHLATTAAARPVGQIGLLSVVELDDLLGVDGSQVYSSVAKVYLAFGIVARKAAITATSSMASVLV